MMNEIGKLLLSTAIAFTFITCSDSMNAQEMNGDLQNQLELLKKNHVHLRHRLDRIEKAIDDLIWFEKLGEIAYIDKVYMTGPPPPAREKSDGSRSRQLRQVLVLRFHSQRNRHEQEAPPDRLSSWWRSQQLHHILYAHRKRADGSALHRRCTRIPGQHRL